VHVCLCFSPSQYRSLRVRTSIIKRILLHFVTSDSISLFRSLPLSFSSLTSLSLSLHLSISTLISESTCIWWQAVADEIRERCLDMLRLAESVLITLASHRTITGHPLHGRIGEQVILRFSVHVLALCCNKTGNGLQIYGRAKYRACLWACLYFLCAICKCMCLTVCVRMCVVYVYNCSSVETHVSLLPQIVKDHE